MLVTKVPREAHEDRVQVISDIDISAVRGIDSRYLEWSLQSFMARREGAWRSKNGENRGTSHHSHSYDRGIGLFAWLFRPICP